MDFIGAGKTLILHDPKPHLWFVLTDPKDCSDFIVAVRIRTAKHFTDSTVILKPGDHPFIRHDSSVDYSSAKYLRISRIQSELKTGKCHMKEDMSNKLLKRARKGLIDSPYTVNAIRDYCKENF